MAVTINDEVIVRVEGAAFESPRFTVDQQFPPGRTTRITVSELGALIAVAGPSSLPPNVSLADGVVVSVAGAQDEDPRITARQQFPTGRTTKLSLAELAALREVGDPVTLPSNVSANDTIVVRVIGSQDEDPRMTADEQFRPGRTTKMTVGNLIALINAEFPLAPPFSPQLESVDLDGSTEFLANTTNNPLGIANAWTLSTVFKFDSFALGEAVITFPSAVAGDSFSSIAMATSGTLGLLVTVSDATGTPTSSNQKQWRWNDVVSNATWVNVVVKWDGVDLFMVVNGVDQGAPQTKFSDASITMADTARKVFIWADRSSVPAGAGNFLYAALWDEVLTDAELLEAWNSGVAGAFDLGADSGNYASSANLQHWWRTCEDDADIGKDSGIASTLIDVLTNAVDISSADCVADVPA